jgi:predicted TIM-barrel fold metal-dependent hydrolase
VSVTTLVSAASGLVLPSDLWARRLPKAYAEAAPQLVDTEKGLAWKVGARLAPPLALPRAARAPGSPQASPLSRADVDWLASAAGRLWLQQREDVSAEVLYSIGGVWNLIQASEDAAFVEACTAAFNEWLGELCASAPDRFIGVAKLPTTGADAATAALTRAVGSLGLRGAVLDAWPGGADCPPAAGECEGFWEAAEALRAPLSIYRSLGGEEEHDPQVAGGAIPDYFTDLTTIIYANIPDKRPGIRFVSLATGAGWAPPAFEALNESYMRTASLRRVNLADPDLYPSDYLRRFFSFVVQEDRVALLNRAYFGEAHMMWGSFALLGLDSAWPNGRQVFERATQGLPEPFRGKLGGENVARLYGVRNATPFSVDEIQAYDNYALL